jgi:site-specific recombinase XerC
MGAKIQRTVAPGVHLLANGSFRVKVAVGDRRRDGQSREKTFPRGTALKTMQRWQTQQRAAFERQEIRVVKGVFGFYIEGQASGDVSIYLGRSDVKSLASYKSRSCDIAAWCPRFGNTLRHLITPDQIADEMETWRAAGIAIWTRRHRLNALRDLFTKLDGKNAPNPARDVTQPKKPKTKPRALPYDVIRASLATMRPTATKAFATIMAFCGFRPEEIRQIAPHDIHLEGTEPFVIRPTAKDGDIVSVPCPPEAVRGWKLWLDKNPWKASEQAWEMDSLSNANRDWKKAMCRMQNKLMREGEPQEAARYEPVPIYSLVHSYCTYLIETGTEITTVQKVRGHKDVRTTQIYTKMTVDPRVAVAVKKAFG